MKSISITIERAKKRSRGYTVLELITTLALVVIVLGLAVSLARSVRTDAADRVTRRVLVELDQAIQAYRKACKDVYPPATVVPDDVSEEQLNTILLENNKQLVELLRTTLSDAGAAGGPQLLKSVEGGAVARDAWGRAIGYLPHQHPQIGMATQNAPFFFSAGLDGRYLTRQDNLYSYEQPQVYEEIHLPVSGGHREQ